MTELLRFLEAAELREATLALLLAVIVMLFLATLGFSAAAVVLRHRNRARDAEAERLRERWRDPVLSAVAEPERVGEIQALVGEDDRLPFVEFILSYTQRVRGEERETLKALARPFMDVVVKRADAGLTEMRAWAVQTLGLLGLPRHEDRVLRALDDPSPLVAMVAARSLARPETPQYAGEILARLDRFDGWSRRFLASMLARMGSEVADALRQRYADESAEPWTRAVCADALEMEGDLQAGDIAARILRHGTESRELAASSLKLLDEVGRPEHADAVRPLCRASDDVIRGLALRAMGTLGGPDDIPALLKAMGDPQPWPALYAARAVRAAGGRAALAEVAETGGAVAVLAKQVLGEEVEAA